MLVVLLVGLPVRKQGMRVKYLVLAVGGSVELQEGTGGVVRAAGVKHAVDLRYRRNTWIENIQKVLEDTIISTLMQKRELR